MSKTIKVDCLRSIYSEEDAGVVRKGRVANLTSEEFKHYDAIGAVKPIAVIKKPAITKKAKSIEGGDV